MSLTHYKDFMVKDEEDMLWREVMNILAKANGQKPFFKVEPREELKKELEEASEKRRMKYEMILNFLSDIMDGKLTDRNDDTLGEFFSISKSTVARLRKCLKAVRTKDVETLMQIISADENSDKREYKIPLHDAIVFQGYEYDAFIQEIRASWGKKCKDGKDCKDKETEAPKSEPKPVVSEQKAIDIYNTIAPTITKAIDRQTEEICRCINANFEVYMQGIKNRDLIFYAKKGW